MTSIIFNHVFKYLNWQDQKTCGICNNSTLLQIANTAKNVHQSQMFLLACKVGLVQCVYLLLEVVSDVDVTSGICFASSGGHVDVVDRLLQMPLNEDTIMQCVRLAVEHNQLPVLKYLFEWGVDIHGCLDLALVQGHLDIIHWLTHDVGDTLHPKAIVFCSWKGNLDVVKYLVSHHLDSQIDAVTKAIEMAAKNGHLEIVNILVHLPSIDTEKCQHAASQLAIATAPYWIRSKLGLTL